MQLQSVRATAFISFDSRPQGPKSVEVTDIIDEGRERDWKRSSFDVTFYYVLYVVWAKPFEV